ncbi:CLUMA_CG018638, isoform A [Clunio marinus]|uniref:CLUMA_CG018638, isoform A n=1 Tax=Clunio marinus TaxID=568069 RepID=A0A1J1IYT3_9DIPT|nr:CLUMA_CG018638, isoform A [Clunio marinus]
MALTGSRDKWRQLYHRKMDYFGSYSSSRKNYRVTICCLLNRVFIHPDTYGNGIKNAGATNSSMH